MAKVKNLYIITVFHMEKKTNEDYEREAKIASIRHNREITLDRIKQMQFSKADLYKFSSDEVAYFDNFDEANEFLVENTCDVYEYCYTYGAILETPLNCAYPFMYSTNLHLYKYDEKNKGYYPADRENINEEMYEAIKAFFSYHEDIAEFYRKENESD